MDRIALRPPKVRAGADTSVVVVGSPFSSPKVLGNKRERKCKRKYYKRESRMAVECM
jgi:hypothetical protein